MKTGRNDSCPCGSGKKYKKCCLSKEEVEPQQEPSKNIFQLKGEKAEDWVYQLASKSFLMDWCYKNPKLPDGKELCDLLVVFGEIVIIWQIKDLKVGKNGQYHESDVKKNLSQLSGAKRSLLDLKKEIELENPRKGKEKFDPTKIKEVYLISALVGEEQNFMSFYEEFKDKKIHVFNKEAVEIILNELNTIKDFTGYLKEKQRLFSLDETKEKPIKRTMWLSGEKDLLAYYLLKGRNFNEFMEYDGIALVEGHWEHLTEKPEYIRKQKEDELSYAWDGLINTIHTCGEGYEKIARELARANRFERRILGKAFFDAHVKAHEQVKMNTYKRIIESGGVTYCFLFVDERIPREYRRNYLQEVCFVARGMYKENNKVIGISTEMKMRPTCSYDFCMLDIPVWGEEEQKKIDEIQAERGTFTDLKYRTFHEDEYPKI